VSGTDAASKASAIALAELRDSVRSKCQQSGMAFGAMIVNTVFCALLLGRGVAGARLGLLLIASTGLLLVRYLLAASTTRTLNLASGEQLSHADTRFRMVSLASQGVTGALIWIVWDTRDEVSAYIVTLLICLYAVGTMVNLSQDYRSFRLTIPLLMLQPALFWLLRGTEGLAIAVILIGLMVLMISSVRGSRRVFEQSVRIRFEKDELVGQLAQEKEVAVRALQQAEVASRSKSFFLAAASHDLRQPLYAATILADTMALHSLPAEASRLLVQQGKALAVASALFDNLLDLSRFESGSIEPSLGCVALREMLDELAAEFAPLCRTKGLTLEVAAADVMVHSDHTLFDRMLRNLISNAVRYTHAGGITLRCRTAHSQAIVSVEDTGIGIALEDQERVFKEFVQIHNPQRARDKGVGLGLAIVRHIALLLGHEIAIESAPGRGTCMSIRMALTNADPADVSTPPELPVTNLDGRHVWIIEDDGDVRDALSSYFATRGCACARARSRNEVEQLQLDALLPPDYVLVDDMLGSHESGLEVAHWLAHKIDPARILIMTGSSDPERWRELQNSMFNVQRKPIMVATLNHWVQQAK
jgi:two-component system, sensor histidine kinase